MRLRRSPHPPRPLARRYPPGPPRPRAARIAALAASALLAAALAPPALAEQAEGEPEQSKEYDPWEGIERDGRIPSVDKPADLPNPERWRYIPEGRIKTGNVFQRLLVSSFIIPLVFRDSDIGTGFGLALTDIDFRRQRRQEFLGAFLSYTTKGQQSYMLVWRRWMHHIDLPDGGVLQEERSFYKSRAGYSKTLTRRFFGFGPDTREDDESSYTDKKFVVQLGFERSLPEPGSNLVLAFGFHGDFHGLDDGEVSDVPSTKSAYPIAFADAEDAKLGWIETSLRWDTRDSVTNPYRGWMVGADIDAALAQNDGDLGAVFRLYGTKIFPLPGLFHRGGDSGEENPPTDVLAFGLRAETSAGELPFFARPTLGGTDTMRGYIDGRFYDQALWLASTEYRFWVVPRGFRFPFTRAIRVERLGAAVFYEVGAVADGFGSLFDSKVRHSYGVGLRLMFERTAPFRIDFGFSDEDEIITLGFGLTF